MWISCHVISWYIVFDTVRSLVVRRACWREFAEHTQFALFEGKCVTRCVRRYTVASSDSGFVCLAMFPFLSVFLFFVMLRADARGFVTPWALRNVSPLLRTKWSALINFILILSSLDAREMISMWMEERFRIFVTIVFGVFVREIPAMKRTERNT